MKGRHAVLLPLILVLGSCATEGGSRGSGISTTVQGNVESVQTAALPGPPRSAGFLAELGALFHMESVARARTEIEGIRVAVEGTGVRGQTDANGAFSVRGDFEGFTSLVFQLPDDSSLARIAIHVPAAGTLTLHNVRIDTQRGEASAETQDIDCEAVIAEIDCQGLTLSLVSIQHSPPDSDRYTVRLDTSSLRDTHGNTLACADLRAGKRVTVQGMVNPDGTFGDATVEVED